MGCSNSHLRPIFRRCRRRRSKKEEASLTPKSELIDRNGSQDLLQGVQLLGASLRNSHSTTTTTNLTTIKSTIDNPPTTDSSAFCVPLLAQSEASTSQIDFFKMLDQRIEEGPDYESDDERERCKHRPSLPNLRLGSTGSERKPMLSTYKYTSKENHLKFTNWNWDEEGD